VEGMSKHRSGAIDLTSVESRARYLPHPPLISSHKAGWENICLEYYQLPPFESPQHYTQDYGLVIHLQNQSLHRRIDKCEKVENIQPGDVAVIPPYVVHWAATAQKSEFLVIILDSNLISPSGCELLRKDNVKVIPHFSKPDPLIYQIGLALKAELKDGVKCRLYAESMATALAAHLLQHYSVLNLECDCYAGLSQPKLRKVTEFILNHLGEDLAISAIANEVSMSKYHFARLFKKSTGLSPYQYVIKCRIERAKKLLSQGNLQISEIGLEVGFADQSQFTRHFKRLTGVTPLSIIK
jgi:AraC family transcriptional regulator